MNKELKETLLHEGGGMTKADFDKQLMKSQVGSTDITGLEVFSDRSVRDMFKTLTR